MQTLKKLSRGSILAYSLILLGIVLTASIGMMAASITNLKSVSSSDKSMNAFQVADSGSQIVVRMLKESSGNELQDVSGVTCDEGDAVVESPASFLAGGSYRVIFQDGDGKTLKCTDNIFDVASVKSVGTYSDTARAVQVAVAAGSCPATGGMILAESSPNADGFDMGKMKNFLDSENARIVEGRCGINLSNRLWAFNGDTLLLSGDTRLIIEPSGSYSYSMECSSATGKCRSSAGSDCTYGWKIFVECPVL